MTDENKNESDENQKNQASDDDFGLPDFEFDALDDDDDEEVNTPDEEQSELTLKEESDEGIEEVDLGDLQHLGDLDKKFGAMEKETSMPEPASADRVEDIFDEPERKEEETTPKESVDKIEDEDLFYEEESFDDFDTDAVEMDSSFNADNAQSGESDIELPDGDESGLDMDLGDDIDLSMFDEEESEVPFAEQQIGGAEESVERQVPDEEYREPTYDEDTPSGRKFKFIRIVVLGTILFTVIAFGFLYLNKMLLSGESHELQKVARNDADKPANKIPPKEDEHVENKTKNTIDEAKKVEEKPEQIKPKPTTPKKKITKKKVIPPKKQAVTSSTGVTTLFDKTGKSYLIVASFVVASSAQKYASKLVSQGKSPTIIPPFGGAANHRVAIASFENFAEAKDHVERYRQQLGNSVWVLKY